MQQPPVRPPPDDNDPTRTKRHDGHDDPHRHDHHPRDPHPDDDRLTESDLDAHERERRPSRAPLRHAS
jgi:hypothetical protein